MHIERHKQPNLENKTVQRILQAALACWGRSGYHGASLKDIADQAKIAKSLVHYHFASKEHLLIELQADYCRQVAAQVRMRLAAAEPSVGSALEALDRVWDAMLEARLQFPFLLEVWRVSVQNEAVRQRLHAFNEELLALFRQGIELSLGPMAADLRLPAERLAELLQVVVGGFELRLFLLPDIARLRRAFEDFKTLIELALLPENPKQGVSS